MTRFTKKTIKYSINRRVVLNITPIQYILGIYYLKSSTKLINLLERFNKIIHTRRNIYLLNLPYQEVEMVGL